jgi:hypothetical protein
MKTTRMRSVAQILVNFFFVWYLAVIGISIYYFWSAMLDAATYDVGNTPQGIYPYKREN